MKKYCGHVLLPAVPLSKEEQKRLKWENISCSLEPGHKGNHYAKTKRAEYTWWNEQDNPQKLEDK